MVVEHWAARGVVTHELYTLLQPVEGAAGSREVSESCEERRGKEWKYIALCYATFMRKLCGHKGVARQSVNSNNSRSNICSSYSSCLAVGDVYGWYVASMSSESCEINALKHMVNDL